jgi:hypothetical protein
MKLPIRSRRQSKKAKALKTTTAATAVARAVPLRRLGLLTLAGALALALAKRAKGGSETTSYDYSPPTPPPTTQTTPSAPDTPPTKAHGDKAAGLPKAGRPGQDAGADAAESELDVDAPNPGPPAIDAEQAAKGS